MGRGRKGYYPTGRSGSGNGQWGAGADRDPNNYCSYPCLVAAEEDEEVILGLVRLCFRQLLRCLGC